MSRITIDGELSVETISSAVGDSVRVAFQPAGEQYIGFSCILKESDLSGNIKAQVAGVKAESPESTMIGYSALSTLIAQVILKKNKEPENTFGIGE